MSPASRPRPTRRSVRKEAGRVDMLRAAAALIAARGYHGMSMRDLASATGMSLANLYNYFPSKVALLLALQTRAFETLIESARTAIDGLTDDDARLHAFILGHVTYVAEHRDVMRVLVEEAGELPRARRREVRALKERYYESGRALVERALAGRAPRRSRREQRLELERVTYSVFGMLNWVYAWYRPARHGTPRAVARSIQRLALNGLAGRPPAERALAAAERAVGRLALRSPVLLPHARVPRR